MKKTLILSAAMLALASISSGAYAIDKIYSPHITQGELEIEYNGNRTFDNDNTKDGAVAHELELEYSPTDRLKLEVSGQFEKEPLNSNTQFTGLELESVFEFTEPGEYWMDSGVLVAYGHAMKRDDADDVEVKLLLQKDWENKITTTVNLGLEQSVGNNSSGGPDRVMLISNRYRYNRHFEPGFELQSDFGQTNINPGYSHQEHYIGPAAYGEIIPNVNYEAAYLFGISSRASDAAARVQLEYELHF